MGCPIRESPDITPADGSPKLIAANHALLRLLAPRHPPYALSSLVRMIIIIIIRQKLIYTFCSVFKVPTPAICCWRLPLIHTQKQEPRTNHIIRHKSGPAYRSGRPPTYRYHFSNRPIKFPNSPSPELTSATFLPDEHTTFHLPEWR